MNALKIILIAGLLLGAFLANAQGAPPATPIDGGLSLLLAAGGAYGLKKIMKVRKEN
ncbi:MAG: hypothetical protein RJQ14_14665 [Marinoscillum sp.]